LNIDEYAFFVFAYKHLSV